MICVICGFSVRDLSFDKEFAQGRIQCRACNPAEPEGPPATAGGSDKVLTAI